MMRLAEAAPAIHGSTDFGEVWFVGVSTDTRRIQPGELFVALKGERFDGHDYVEQALAAGAAGALVEAGWAQQRPYLPLLAAADTRLALGELAAYWREDFSLPLIGITGSNGKTTVKEMCAAILRAQACRDIPGAGDDEDLLATVLATVLATEGNLNNDIGVPLMLLKLRSQHCAAVIEMGMNHPGEIAYLTRLARPTVALVNNAQRAHLAGLGGLNGVALAKGEIFAGLMPQGVAVINADDPHAGLWRELAVAAGAQLLTFGMEQAADVSARCSLKAFGSQLHISTPQGDIAVELQVPGLHNAKNALAATAATLAAGCSLEAIVSGLESYRGIKGRLQQWPALNGARVIDDTYNANPDSMRAAIDVLAAQPGKKILVIGDMGEVGVQSGQFHDEIGGYAKSMGLDRLLALGEQSVTAVKNFAGGGTHFKNPETLLAALQPLLDADTTVLVKGSRFMKMERVVDAIKEDAHAAGPSARSLPSGGQGGDNQPTGAGFAREHPSSPSSGRGAGERPENAA
ncbi:MAG: UDP-N-acetylmuramoyl-tripeptide--D-alanyl-D-alanine ligase [Betaproteobacteria bacterium]|nr:UDP-N-acetylmuramoyl-tripeptide--D-alanyl-D-alanine ligase [Betaproteobacteria bacterium]